MTRYKLIFVIFCALACNAACTAKIQEYIIKVVKEYPHDTNSYTQGLFFYDGRLIETTGQYGSSTLRELDLSSGEALSSQKFSRKYFVEGSTVLNGELFILTWTNKVAFVYDISTLKYKRTLSYPREGWGLTSDGKQLIASDGSSTLFFMDANLRATRQLTVTINGRPLRLLNELEYVNGKIWANVYLSDMIVIINPSTGVVEACVDCSELLPEKLRTVDTDVLNGIAYDDKEDKIYLTGKNWPKMYQIQLIR